MKRLLYWALPTLLGICLFTYPFKFHSTKPTDTAEKVRSASGNESEDQDGILAAQEQEFNSTKDVRLGYIPQDRLIRATNELAQAKRAAMARGTQTTSLSWTERGPSSDGTGPSNGNSRGPSGSVNSGRIRAIWVDLSDATNKTVWIGGVDGGIWETTDITASPANWTPVSDLFSNMAVSSICQDPVNKNTMYFGTGEKTFNADAVRGGGVWKSTDHGVTWNLLSNTTTF